MNYRAFLARIAPTVLRGYWGSRLVGAIGLQFDELSESAIQALRAAWLDDAIGPAMDAIGAAGNELSLQRYPTETDEAYLPRLKRAWADWAFAGDESAMIGQFAAAGVFENAEIKYDQSWDWDGDDYWSRFWVVLKGHGFTQWLIGDGHTIGGGQTIGSSATYADVANLKQLVRKWKPAHWICLYIIIVHDEVAWDADQPDGTWDVDANRNPAATYIDPLS